MVGPLFSNLARASFAGWGLERPLGLTLLALPVLLWLLARRPERPRERTTGTLAWWGRLAVAQQTRGAHRRRRLPLSTAFALMALLAGVASFVGPRLWVGESPRRWSAVVDTRRTMGLPAPGESGRTRMEVALQRCLTVLEERASKGDSVLWLRHGRDPLELALGELPPEAWLRPGGALGLAPVWERFDEPGCLWVSDLAPESEPAAAGWVASGAEPEPGPIARAAHGLLLWDGVRAYSEHDGVGVGRVAIRASGEGGRLGELYRIWAEERGLEFVRAGPAAPGSLGSGGPDFELVLEIADSGPDPVHLVGGRDRWWAEGPCARDGVTWDGLEGDGEVWLTAESNGSPGDSKSVPLVIASMGRIRVAWSDWTRLAGDTTELALAFSRLFEAHLLLPDEVVSLAERRLAGESGMRAPLPAPAVTTGEQPSEVGSTAGAALLGAILASLSAVLALTACTLGFGLGLGLRSSRSP